MKPLLATVVLFALTLAACDQGSPSGGADDAGSSASDVDRTATPLDVVNRRMDAYNRHDLGAFLGAYADDVEVYTYPDRSLGGGKDHMGSIFQPLFEQGVVQVEIHHQIAKDGYVVNHETVTDGDETTEYVSIYEVRDGLIQSVRFVRD
jgi:hypothetical protein